MGPLTTATTVAILALLGAYIYQRANQMAQLSELKRKKGCGAPKKYRHIDPIFGSDYLLAIGKAMNHRQLLQFSRSLFDRYGRTFQVNSWGTTIIDTIEPKNAQTVLSLSFSNFGVMPVKTPSTGGAFQSKGILTSDGPIWERSRALIKPTFARPQLTNFDTFETHLSRMFDLIPNNEATVDLQPLLKLFVRCAVWSPEVPMLMCACFP